MTTTASAWTVRRQPQSRSSTARSACGSRLATHLAAGIPLTTSSSNRWPRTASMFFELYHVLNGCWAARFPPTNPVWPIRASGISTDPLGGGLQSHGVVRPEARGEQAAEQPQVAADRADLRRRRAVGRVPPRDRELTHPQAESGRPERQVVVQIVADEHVTHRGDPRVYEQPPAVAAEPVGRVRVAEPARQRDQRRVQELHPEAPRQRQVLGDSARQEPRPLDVVQAVSQLLDEPRDRV